MKNFIRKIFLGAVVLFFLSFLFLWFFGIGLCSYNFKMPVSVTVERVDFPYKNESFFDNITVRYTNLSISPGKYDAMIKYLFYEPSFDVEYYSYPPSIEYATGNVWQNSINLIKIFDGGAFYPREQIVHVDKKGRTEKIISVSYYVPIDSSFLDKYKFYSNDKTQVGDFRKYPGGFDPVTKRFEIYEREFRSDGIREVYPTSVVYSSESELRTVKYKIIIDVPSNPFKGYFGSHCFHL